MDGQPTPPSDDGGQSSGTTPIATDQSVLDRIAAHDRQLEQLMSLLRAQTTAITTLTAAITPSATEPAAAPIIQGTPITTVMAKVPTPTTVLETHTEATTPVSTHAVTFTQTLPENTFEASLSAEAKLTKEFVRFQTGYFTGGGDPEAAARWLLAHEKLHNLLKIHDSIRARISGLHAPRRGGVWWTAHTETHGEPITWDGFRQAFYDQYIPREIQLRLRQEFLCLRQGNRTVVQYMERFRYLLQFAGDLASTARDQVHYFGVGLRDEIASAVVSSGAHTLQEIYERALSHETYLIFRAAMPMPQLASGSSHQGTRYDRKGKRIIDYRDMRVQRPRHDHQAVTSHAIVPAQPTQLSGGYAPRQGYGPTQDQGGRNRGQYGQIQGQRPYSGQGQKSAHAHLTCFKCNQPGHIKKECPMASVAPSAAPPSQARERVHAVAQPEAARPPNSSSRIQR
ncbi:hypothetical protein Syun_014895 [Stephania yunnanensis]|uniref:CCHC-type domain-containing protein n=1 Tax=Stephania yunnanensis TaxID=152371 RepID=A0AAP0PCA1_9MAGN